MSSRSAALAIKLRELKLELDSVLEKKSVYEHDINRAILSLHRLNRAIIDSTATRYRESGEKTPEINASSIPPQEQKNEKPLEEIEKEVDDSPAPAWAKKAYKQIAVKTHPDKVRALPSITDSEAERLGKLYLEAVESYKTKNYDVLLEIAIELEIPVEVPDSEIEKGFESKLKEIRKEIDTTKKKISWAWGISFGDVDKRVKVLTQCANLMSIPVPARDALEEIIRELENSPEFDVVDRLGRIRRIRSGADRRKVGTRPERMIR